MFCRLQTRNLTYLSHGRSYTVRLSKETQIILDVRALGEMSHVTHARFPTMFLLRTFGIYICQLIGWKGRAVRTEKAKAVAEYDFRTQLRKCCMISQYTA